VLRRWRMPQLWYVSVLSIYVSCFSSCALLPFCFVFM
jgi:hypothetical protein